MGLYPGKVPICYGGYENKMRENMSQTSTVNSIYAGYYYHPLISKDTNIQN